jgi:hypothetical protein
MQPQDQNQPIVNETPQDNQPAEMPVSDLAATVNAEADQIKTEKYQDTYSQPTQSMPDYNTSNTPSVGEATQPEMVSETKDFLPNPVIADNSETATAQPVAITAAPEKKKSNMTVILIAVLVLVVVAAAYIVAKYVLNLF